MESSNDGLFYRPLDVASNEVRLIRLHPNRDLKSIPRCGIFHASLDQSIEYNALSHAWGSSDLKGNITAQGQHIEVGQNLAHALSDIRHGEVTIVLWADALCIDQRNYIRNKSSSQTYGRDLSESQKCLCLDWTAGAG